MGVRFFLTTAPSIVLCYCFSVAVQLELSSYDQGRVRRDHFMCLTSGTRPIFVPSRKVIVTEEFDEGLMVLRRLLDWQMIDMTYSVMYKTEDGSTRYDGKPLVNKPRFEDLPRNVSADHAPTRRQMRSRGVKLDQFELERLVVSFVVYRAYARAAEASTPSRAKTGGGGDTQLSNDFRLASTTRRLRRACDSYVSPAAPAYCYVLVGNGLRCPRTWPMAGTVARLETTATLSHRAVTSG